MSVTDPNDLEQQQRNSDSDLWSDQTVDAISGFAIVVCVTLMALWYVMN